MRSIIFLLCMFLNVSCIAQGIKLAAWDTSKVIKLANGKYQLKDGLPDGTYQVHWDLRGEQVIIVASYKNGKRTGPYTEFYDYFKGVKAVAATYDDKGQLHGLYMAWYGKDALSDSGTYVHGKINGIYTSWSQHSRNRTEYNYSNGLKQGKAVEYNRNGAKVKEWIYKDDKLHGGYIAWHPNGKIAETITYSDNKKGGESYTYTDKGLKKSYIEYKDDKKAGIEYIYNDSGKVSGKRTYVNDLMEGPFLSWYPSGKIADSIMFRGGKENGIAVGWYENGNMKYRKFYKEGNIKGDWAAWNENGTYNYIKIFYYGSREEYVWHKNGKVSSEEKHVKMLPQEDIKRLTWDTVECIIYTVSANSPEEYDSPGKLHVTEAKGKRIVVPNQQKVIMGLDDKGKYQPGLSKGTGYKKTYAENGKLVYVTHYKDGKQHGPEIKWNQEGIKQSEGNYKIITQGKFNGRSMKDGKWTYWDYKGNLSKEEHYKDGELVEEKNY